MQTKIKSGDKVLFIGDSITDCGRRGPEAPYGSGYVRMVRDLLIAAHPEKRIAVINKGIGGDIACGLNQRWQDDVIFHKPDILTVLIGINDCHRYLFNDPGTCKETTPEKYRFYYNSILAQTKKAFPRVSIIILEPFFIARENNKALRDRFEALKPYRKIAAEMGEKYGDSFIPLHTIFQEHLRFRETETFCPEPVHPNLCGHLLMARELFRVLDS